MRACEPKFDKRLYCGYNANNMATSVRELKDRLSHYLHQVESGQTVVITSHKKPVAKLVPISESEVAALSVEDFLNDLEGLHKRIRKNNVIKPLSETVIEQRVQERT